MVVIQHTVLLFAILADISFASAGSLHQVPGKDVASSLSGGGEHDDAPGNLENHDTDKSNQWTAEYHGRGGHGEDNSYHGMLPRGEELQMKVTAPKKISFGDIKCDERDCWVNDADKPKEIWRDGKLTPPALFRRGLGTDEINSPSEGTGAAQSPGSNVKHSAEAENAEFESDSSEHHHHSGTPSGDRSNGDEQGSLEFSDANYAYGDFDPEYNASHDPRFVYGNSQFHAKRQEPAMAGKIPLGVYECENMNFKPPCGWAPVVVNKCYKRSYYPAVHGSFGPDMGLQCTLHYNDDCTGMEQPRIEWPGLIDMKENGGDDINIMNPKSFYCERGGQVSLQSKGIVPTLAPKATVAPAPK